MKKIGSWSSENTNLSYIFRYNNFRTELKLTLHSEKIILWQMKSMMKIYWFFNPNRRNLFEFQGISVRVCSDNSQNS